MKRRKIALSLIFMLSILPALAGRMPSTYTMSKNTLLNKIKGGWAGQTIGVTYGGPTEFKYLGRTIPDTTEITWPEHQCKWYFDHEPFLYDDIYMDLTFVGVYDKLGLDAPADAFAKAFAYARYELAHANQQARYNIAVKHLKPLESGHWKNNPHADDIDFQIEADFSGLMSPGMPNAAIHFGDRIGHLMNYGDGWYGGVFVGTMYSLAFVSSNIAYIVDTALRAIPRQSTFYQCISDVIRWHKEHPDNWRTTWQLVQDKWADEITCPDGVMQPFNIDAKLNSAYVVMGLLYGEGDFGKSLEISTRCGQDSDCNPSTVGGILGVISGYDGIPELWMKPLREIEDIPFKYTGISLNKAYGMSYGQALQVIERFGGKVGSDAVEIRVEEPLVVRFEQSYDGLYLAEKRGLGNKSVQDVGAIRFDGCGIVVRGKLDCADKKYVGEVEVWLDGKKIETRKWPSRRWRNRAPEAYSLFGLPDMPHVLTFKFLNLRDSVKTDLWSILVYKYKKTGTEVFTTARDAEVPYRIPAIAQTKTGDLIYFTDYRPCKDDIGFGRVDQHYRISRDGGKTWEAEQILVEGTGVKGAMDCAYGDPVIAADRESDELYLGTGCCDRPYYAATTTRQNPFPMVNWRSKDGGKTWSRPRDITEQIYGMLDKGSLGPAQSLFFSSGRMMQSRMVKKGRYYRLYVAILVRGQGNYVLYSDDFGNNWKILGGNQVQPCLKGDEAKCEELPDGSVLLSSRKHGGRFFNIFNYTDVKKGRGTWQQCAASQDDNHGCRATDNFTNGEILSVKAVRQEDQKEVTLLLQSVPLGPGRSHVGIWYKALESKADYASPAVIARNWEDFFQVTARNSAYSTMIQLHDGSIAFAWEEATYDQAYTEMFRRLTVEEITCGKYK